MTKSLKLEEKLLNVCLKHQITLGAAESCTGGALAARITQIPGASTYFMGSIVSYTNRIKTRILGVPTKILEQYGAVSVPVALMMLEGALLQFSCDIAVAVTGVAGPTGDTPKTPIGTVIIAIGGKKLNPKIVTLQLEGDRQEIIQQSVRRILEELLEICDKNW